MLSPWALVDCGSGTNQIGEDFCLKPHSSSSLSEWSLDRLFYGYTLYCFEEGSLALKRCPAKY